jgi:hypothetical protein
MFPEFDCLLKQIKEDPIPPLRILIYLGLGLLFLNPFKQKENPRKNISQANKKQ